MTHFRRWLAAIAIFACSSLPALAQIGPGGASNMYCQSSAGPPAVFAPCSSTNPLNVTGTFSASIAGYRPVSAGTPISVTSASTTGTLPTNTGEVVATNVGTTNGAYCALGATATTSSQYIAPNGGWFAFAISGDTQLSCITSTSTTTVNVTGGSGLPTGTGGGGGGSLSGSQSNASTGTTGSTNVPVVSYGYLWNGSAWQQAQPSTLGSGLSSAGILVVGASDWRETSGNVVTVQVTVPGLSSTTYGVGKEAGTLITLAAIGATPNNSGRIKDFTLTANVVMTNAWRMAFFDSNPTNSTFTDNSTPAINSADIAKERCVIRFTHANSDLGTHTIWKPLPSELAECGFSGTTGYGLMIAPDGASAALAANGLVVTGEFSYNN